LVDGRCQIVWTAPHEEAEALLQLPRDLFLAELQRRYGDQMGALKMLQEPLRFPVKLMQSRCYVRPRLALLGDAAHGCHPVGGQGLNMGIRDAAALAAVLAQARDRGEDLGSLPVLRRYHRWRWWENWLVLVMTDVLNRSFSNQWGPW
jgi:2-octaprenyl-6-methoxyphenol hydroxylase